MRMPPDHLVMNLANHLGYGEASFLASDLRVKNNLQKQIPHLFRELRVASTFEGFHDFVGFFDEVSSQRLMRLLAVPGAPVRSPQSGLHGDELFKPLPGRQLFLLCRLPFTPNSFSFLSFLPAPY